MKLHSKSADEAAAEKENRTDKDNAAIEVMRENEKYADDPLLGFFWYDKNKNELFGVTSTPASDCKWHEASQGGAAIRTDRRLFKNIWEKECLRGKDRRFTGDYSSTPHGRVFEIENKGYRVYTGEWIDDFPQVKDEILFEFQLPEEDTVFIKIAQ